MDGSNGLINGVSVVEEKQQKLLFSRSFKAITTDIS